MELVLYTGKAFKSKVVCRISVVTLHKNKKIAIPTPNLTQNLDPSCSPNINPYMVNPNPNSKSNLNPSDNVKNERVNES